jgi:hypothetical protein
MFLVKLFQAVLSGDLNVIGLLLGFVGGLLVTFFGLPSREILSKGSYVEMQDTPRMRLYDVLSRIGIGLVAIGFVLQLIPAVESAMPR